MAKVRLLAHNTEDLEVIAAHLQDTILKVGDLAYLRKARRFAAAGTRFCWEHVDVSGPKPRPKKGKSYYRTQSGFHFDDVLNVRMRGFNQSDGESLLVLLELAFVPGEDGAGTIRMVFAGGALIELDVECVSAALSDLSAPWPSDNLPTHED